MPVLRTRSVRTYPPLLEATRELTMTGGDNVLGSRVAIGIAPKVPTSPFSSTSPPGVIIDNIPARLFGLAITTIFSLL